jgi:hypothetical protein
MAMTRLLVKVMVGDRIGAQGNQGRHHVFQGANVSHAKAQACKRMETITSDVTAGRPTLPDSQTI